MRRGWVQCSVQGRAVQYEIGWYEFKPVSNTMQELASFPDRPADSPGCGYEDVETDGN